MKKTIAIISAIVAFATMIFTSCGQTSSQPVDLTGKWTIGTIDGNLVPVGLDIPSIEFMKPNQYSANTGVNYINGSFKVDGNTLILGEGMMTRMAGTPEAMAIEEKIVAIFAEPLSIKEKNGVLTLTTKEGTKMELKRK